MIPQIRTNRSYSISSVPRPAVVFDLDETLVHSTLIAPRSGQFFQMRVHRRHVFVQTRPGLSDFLTRIQKIYDVYFFTASLPEYADPIIDKIAPGVRRCRRFFRDSCKTFSGYFVKDLSILRRPIGQTLLIDDIAGSALVNQANLIRVKPWMGDPTDSLLMDRLLPLLERVAVYSDVVSHTRELMLKTIEGPVCGFPVPSI
jgi:RNA polymerase II subunit A small phosphatase-like protein